MRALKYLAVAAGLLLGTCAYSQDIPKFKRSFVADTKFEPIVSAKGPILWMSEGYNSDGYELRGYIDIPIKLAGLWRAMHFKLGAITRIDGNTVESIIYTNTRTKETLSDYDRMIARKEGINTDKIMSLWHEKYDLSDSTIKNLETGEVRKMNGASEFQQLYFTLPKDRNLDTLVTIHFCGTDYPIDIKIKNGSIEADLTYPDPSDPSERKDLILGIKSMSVHTDSYGLPDRMVAGAKFGVSFQPECRYDPNIKWEEFR